MSSFDDSLIEVWEMKEAVYNDFKNSKFDNIVDFIENEMIPLRKKYNLKYYQKEKEEKQLKAAK
jgi:Lhr-like helicase